MFITPVTISPSITAGCFGIPIIMFRYIPLLIERTLNISRLVFTMTILEAAIQVGNIVIPMVSLCIICLLATHRRDAALSITQWVTNYYEGDGTLLGALLALKNSGVPGVKNVKTGKYPLDRGTGNYIQALLDRYELLGNLSDVEMVGQIIRNTISTSDTFELLRDVESTWFYTVLLQSVCRFVVLKHQLQQYDEDYQHATQSLVHYATGMAEHEYAYLDKPEILEFPNQTWSGQDLRKICI